MGNDHKDLFRAAAQHFYREYKKLGGTQHKLAAELGVTQSYLSSILKGSRPSSLDLQVRIANRLYGPFDKFLVAGRNIMAGRSPHEEKPQKAPDDAENLLAHLTHHVIHKKHIEAQLQASEQKFKDICLTSGDMVFEMDQDLRFTYLTGKVKEIYGRDPKEIIGRQPFGFFDADEAERVRAIVDAAIRDRTVFNFVVCDSRDRRKRYRSTTGRPIFSAASGEYLGVRGVIKDITEKVRLEQEAEEHNWLLEAAIDAMEDLAVLIIDRDDRVLRWNKNYKKIFSYPQEVLETRNLQKYIEYVQDQLVDSEDHRRSVRTALATPEDTSHYLKLKDGRTLKRKVKSMHRDGQFAGRIVFLREVEGEEEG